MNMAPFNWLEVHGQKFVEAEAREASDFEEVLANFGMDPEDAFKLFQRETLTIAKRLVFAAKVSTDDAARMLLSDPDDRICRVIQTRLQKERLDANGGIIY